MPKYSSYSALGTTIQGAEIDDGAITEIKTDGSVAGATINLNTWQWESVDAGTWTTNINAVKYGAQYVTNTSTSNGDALTYKVFLPKGTYKIAVLQNKHTTMGIVDFKFNTVEKTSMDFYGATVDNFKQESANFFITESDTYNMQLIVDGKNGSSTGYGVQIIALSIIKVSNATS